MGRRAARASRRRRVLVNFRFFERTRAGKLNRLTEQEREREREGPSIITLYISDCLHSRSIYPPLAHPEERCPVVFLTPLLPLLLLWSMSDALVSRRFPTPRSAQAPHLPRKKCTRAGKLLSWPPRSFLSGPFTMGGDLPPGRRDAHAVQIRVCSFPTVCLRPGMDIELCCTVDPCPIIAIEH